MKKTDPEVSQAIKEIWMAIKSQKPEGQNPTAQEVIDFFQQTLRGEQLTVNVPGLRKVQDLVRPLRKDYETLPPDVKELDRPWSLATLRKHPIPPESLSKVMEAWVWYQENRFDTFSRPFSIREAQWVARLCFVISDISKLGSYACTYALTEQAADLIGGIQMTSSMDVKIYGLMIEKEISSERKMKILRESKIQPQTLAKSFRSIFSNIGGNQ